MLVLSLSNKIEFIFGLFLWWTAVYLFTQNPFNRLVQIASALLASISLYFSGLVLLSLGRFEPVYYAEIVRSFIWTMYLPMPLLYHASLIIYKGRKTKWQIPLLYFAYIMAVLLFLLELKTNLLRDYTFFLTPNFKGNLNEATGKLFWLSGIFFTPILAGITINFLSIAKSFKKYSTDWLKYFLPAIGAIFAICLGPLTVLSYYKLFFSSDVLSVLAFAVVILPLLYSIIRYNLFLDEIKIVFNKAYVYNTSIIFAFVILYVAILTRFNFGFHSIPAFATLYILLHVSILTHPIYNWLLTFSRDLLFNASSGFSVVNDEEVLQALKDYNHPEKLEQSQLLRLDSIKETARKSKQTPIDVLRTTLKEAINYLSIGSEDLTRRNKQNLKYYAIKMLALDEAEEGQILWELGFDDYPVRILKQERNSRPPLFRQTAPSDYSYTSRNAYLAIKKEAIHNVAWRISYLEKQHCKKY